MIATRTCLEEGCDRKNYGHGLCNAHWQRQYRRLRASGPVRTNRPRGVSAQRDDQGRKQCVRCEAWRNPSEFGSHHSTADRKHTYCKRCVESARVAATYAVTPAAMEMMRQSQNDQCAICRTGLNGRGVVDHDHSCCPGATSCGQCVRGLLCNPCNWGLGQFSDDPTRLLAAVEYLKPANVIPSFTGSDATP